MKTEDDIFSTSTSEEADENSIEMQDFAKKRKEKVDNFVLEMKDPVSPDEKTQQETEKLNEAPLGPTADFPAVGSVELPQKEEVTSFSGGIPGEFEKYGEQPPKTQEKPPKKEKRKKKNGCLYGMIYLVVIALVSIIASQFIIKGAYDLLGAYKEDGEATIVIEQDSDLGDIIDQLAETGVVKEPFFFRLYATVTKAKFYPGTYNISTNLDYEAIINELQMNSNRLDVVKLTFVEGSTIEQIGTQLENARVCTKDEFIETVKTGDFSNYSFIGNITNPEERYYKLEGYMFPDTYEFYLYSTPKTVIRKFLDNYNRRITAEMLERADDLGMTMDQVLTMASLIEKEAANDEDRRKVASVFYNRLKNPAQFPKLESNTTDYYPYTKETVPEGFQSTYNTYEIEGLPPGPICNPGISAINAALYPATTNYYFFNMDVNGKAYYATTLAQHNQNIATAESVQKIEPASSEAASEQPVTAD